MKGFMTGKAVGAGTITSGVDAIGSYTLKQSAHTHRENVDLENIKD